MCHWYWLINVLLNGLSSRGLTLIQLNYFCGFTLERAYYRGRAYNKFFLPEMAIFRQFQFSAKILSARFGWNEDLIMQAACDDDNLFYIFFHLPSEARSHHKCYVIGCGKKISGLFGPEAASNQKTAFLMTSVSCLSIGWHQHAQKKRFEKTNN